MAGLSPKLRARVLAGSPVCRICRKAPATAVDHIWPAVYGGTNDESNLQAVCKSCNSKKKDQLPPGMLPLFGQLEKVERIRPGNTPHAMACARAYWARRRARETPTGGQSWPV